jgi:type II secretory pathway component GspD/PulD (secretin)
MGLQRHKRRATGLVVAGALSATLLVGSRLYAKADGGQTQGRNANVLANTTIDLDLAESPLKAAIRLVEQKTGISVVVQGGTALTGTVTLSVKDKPINEVLRLMANAAGADFWEADGIYFFGPKGSAPKPAETGAALPIEPSRQVGTASPAFAVEKIRLLYADPHNIAHLLGADNTPMGTMMEVFEAQVISQMLAAQNPGGHRPEPYTTPNSISVIGGPKTSPNVVPTAPNNGYDLNPALNGVGGAGGAGGGGGQFGGGQGFGGGGQGFGGGGQGFGGGQGQGGGGQGFGGGGQGQGQGQGTGIGSAVALLPDGIQSLLAFSNDGSLLVKYDPARPEALTELRKIIRLLDVKPRQIQVKTEFVTVSQNDIDSFGINFQFQKVNLVGGTNTGFAGTGGQAFLQYATGNLSTQLSFALTTGHAKVVAAPLITTLNNMPVAFFVQSLVPIFTSSTVLGNGGQTIVTPQINVINVQTGLSFVARINGDESLTVFGAATNYVLGANFTDASGNSFPNITNQTTPIQRIIRNGDTIVIGGLNSKNDTVNTLKVPLLGDLPFIGNLFRSRNVTTDDKELLIFVTPTILPERISTASIGGGGGAAVIPTGGGGALPLPGPTP